MPRLKFDLKPIDRNGRDWQTQEANDAWVLGIFQRNHPGQEPAACDCGFWGDDWLVICNARDRRSCKATAAKRLEDMYRRDHLEGLKAKRKFPGVPHPRLGNGFCQWCAGELTLLKSGKRPQRWTHDGRPGEPNCKLTLLLHTSLDAQRRHLFERDGGGCFGCGKLVVVWGRGGRVIDPDVLRARDKADDRFWHGIYPPKKWVGQFTPAGLVFEAEVDHFIALAVAFECFPEAGRRRWFFGPMNLRLLCKACHTAKTRRDIALLKEVRALGPEMGKTLVLEILANAGLLKGA